MPVLFTDTFPFKTDGPFWSILVNTLERDATRSLIILGSSSSKKRVLDFFQSRWTAEAALPELISVDSLLQHITPSLPIQTPLFTPFMIDQLIKQVPYLREAFGQIADRPGFAKQLQSVIYANKAKTIQVRHPAIKRFIKEYEKETQRLAQGHSGQETADSRLSRYLDGRSVFIIGLTTLSPQQEDILERCVRHSPTSSILIHYDENNPSYHYSHRLVHWLHERFPEAQTIASPAREQKRESLAVTQLPRLEQELQWLCDSIRNTLANSPQYSLEDICIVMPRASSFQTKLLQCLKKNGIAFQKEQQIQLSATPLAQFFLQLIDVILSDFEPDRLASFLLSGFATQFQMESKSIPIRADLLITLSKEYFIKKDIQVWLSRLDDYKAQLQDKLDRLSHSIKKDTLLKQLRSLSEHAQFLSEFNHLKTKILKSNDLKTTLSQLYALLNRFQIKEQLLAPNQDSQDKALGLTTYTSLLDCCEQSLDLFRLSGIAASSDSFLKQIVSNLDSYYFHAPTPPQHGVDCIEIKDAYMRIKPICYLPHFIEGMWPDPTPSPLFFNQPHDDIAYFSLINAVQSAEIIHISFPEMRQSELAILSHLSHRLFTDLSLQITVQPPKTPPSYISPIKPTTHSKQAIPKQGGVFQKQSILSSLKKHFKSHSFSASEFERYQNCPRQYYFSTLLGLSEEKDVVEDISASLWGLMIHEIFYTFFSQLKKKHLTLSPTQLKDRQSKLYLHLFSCAKTIFDRYNQNSFYWNVKHDILFGSDDKKGLLDLFIEEENSADLFLEPSHFELPFSLSLEDHAGPTRIKGNIDMILSNDRSPYFIVLDYKTGKTLPTSTDLKTFRSLQLPIYLLAGTQLLNTRSPAGAVFYHMKDRHHFGKKVVCCTKETKKTVFHLDRKRPFIMDELFFNALKRQLHRLKNSIVAGKFSEHPFPEIEHMLKKRPDSCRYCSYKLLCNAPNRFSR